MLLTKEHFEQAKANGIGYQTLYFRVYYYGWDIETAIHTPPHERFGNVKKLPNEIIETAKKNGISETCLWNRLYRGWSLEKAITVKPKKNGRLRKCKSS